jgi:glycosyltransferase involved in cell wall biosynthesis
MNPTNQILNIIFVTPYRPDIVRVRPYQFIRHLSKLGHKVTLVYYDSPDKLIPGEELKSICQNIYAFPLTKLRAIVNCSFCLLTKKPLQAAYGLNKKMANHLIDLIRNEKILFDLIHFEHLRSVEFGRNLIKNNPQSRIRMIWDSVDSITHLFRQAARQHPMWAGRKFLEFETNRTAKYEPYFASLFDKVLVTSKKDQQIFNDLLQKENLKADINVVANGVDLEYFGVNQTRTRVKDTLVISGKMSYHANQRMVEKIVLEIMPLIWKKKPSVKLWIVGQNPSQDIINFGNDPRILVTGYVDDIRPYLMNATIAVAPLAYGAGIQNKILEAMACSTPVIASPIALQALSAIPGQDLLSAEDTQSFANAIIGLLSDPDRCEKIGNAGRLFVENHHTWKIATEKLVEIYQESIKSLDSLYS